MKVPQTLKIPTLMVVFFAATLASFCLGMALIGGDDLFASAWRARFAIIVPFAIGGAVTWMAMWLIFNDTGFVAQNIAQSSKEAPFGSYLLWIAVAIALVAVFSV